MHRLKYFGLIVFGWLLFSPAGGAQASLDSSRLKVGLHVYPPFVIQDEEGAYYGLSVDLWYQLAAELDLSFQFVEYSDLLGMIRALDYEELDIAINPLEVNSQRVEMFDVTQPFFITSLGVCTAGGSSQIRTFLGNIFSLGFLQVILLLLFIIFIFGFLLWLAERRLNSYQFRKGWKGLLDGLWWSAVTMTTVGYGDKAPKTNLGKTIAMVWMFTAIIIISSFTASITSTLTVNSLANRIESLEDLRSIDQIGSIRYSQGENFLKLHDIEVQQIYRTPLEGLRALSSDEIEVLVYDKTVMDYLINEYNLEQTIHLLPVTFNKQFRSFLLPRNSPLLDQLNPRLVDKIHLASWHQILKKYNIREE